MNCGTPEFSKIKCGSRRDAFRAAQRGCTRLSDAPGPGDRRPGGSEFFRHHRAAYLAISFAASRTAICRRSPPGRDRQYRDRAGRARDAGWLHAASGQFAEHDQCRAVSQSSVRFRARYYADCRGVPRAAGHGSVADLSRPRPCRNSSLMPKPIRARSIWHRPASAARSTSPANCSSSWPASISCMCPITARRRRWSICLAGQVQVMFDVTPSSLPQIKAGKLRALAVTTPERLDVLPGVPANGRISARLRSVRLDRFWRAEGNADRDRRLAQQGDQCGARRSERSKRACSISAVW